jgi:radical SAM superfamily enzyme YgiQ (UPF0313 family)
VADEMAYLRSVFPQVREFFFDDDTFTANLPRAREIARKLAPLGLTWSCNSRANLDLETILALRDSGLRLLLVGYESGNAEILRRIKKGVTLEEMRRFTRACHEAGVIIHGTFILGLPVETPRRSRRASVSPRSWMCSASRFHSPLLIPARTLRDGPTERLVRKSDKAATSTGTGFRMPRSNIPG